MKVVRKNQFAQFVLCVLTSLRCFGFNLAAGVAEGFMADG